MDVQAEQRLSNAATELARWINNAAYKRHIENHWCLNQEELVAEAYVKLATITEQYMGKPYPDFIKLAKVAIWKHFGTLLYKSTLTSRKTELHNKSLEQDMREGEFAEEGYLKPSTNYYASPDGSSCISTMSDRFDEYGLSPERLLDAKERLEAILDELNELDRSVLLALLGCNERLPDFLDLARQRKQFVYKDGCIIITPLLVSRALCMDVDIVQESFQRIKSKLTN